MEEQQTDILYEQTIKIMSSINEDKPITTLNETDLLIKTLPESFIEKHPETKKLLEEIKKTLRNPDMIRSMRLIQNIKSELETSTEYYDEDVGTDKRLNYNKEFEIKLTILNEKIRLLLSKVNQDLITEDIDYD